VITVVTCVAVVVEEWPMRAESTRWRGGWAAPRWKDATADVLRSCDTMEDLRRQVLAELRGEQGRQEVEETDKY
jgi:hypothetical protein